MEAEMDYSKIKFSPACPMPVPFDVQKRLQELRSFLDPTTPTTINPKTSTTISKSPLSSTRKGKSWALWWQLKSEVLNRAKQDLEASYDRGKDLKAAARN